MWLCIGQYMRNLFLGHTKRLLYLHKNGMGKDVFHKDFTMLSFWSHDMILYYPNKIKVAESEGRGSFGNSCN